MDRSSSSTLLSQYEHHFFKQQVKILLFLMRQGHRLTFWLLIGDPWRTLRQLREPRLWLIRFGMLFISICLWLFIILIFLRFDRHRRHWKVSDAQLANRRILNWRSAATQCKSEQMCDMQLLWFIFFNMLYKLPYMIVPVIIITNITIILTAKKNTISKNNKANNY